MCSVIAQSPPFSLPYGVAYPILQCALFFGGLWGIYAFKEIVGSSINVFWAGGDRYTLVSGSRRWTIMGTWPKRCAFSPSRAVLVHVYIPWLLVNIHEHPYHVLGQTSERRKAMVQLPLGIATDDKQRVSQGRQFCSCPGAVTLTAGVILLGLYGPGAA